ncbi:hypothetical protein [Actinomadura kijaniata]|uniref:hypothetical protein n=1 Tax=Actinomadura kijaniata TaxID=46161 RepID=UPI003F530019
MPIRLAPTTRPIPPGGACLPPARDRARAVYGQTYANGSNQYMGYNSAYVTTKLRQKADNHYVIDNTCT